MNEEYEEIQSSHHPKMGLLDQLKFLQKRSCLTSPHWRHTQPLNKQYEQVLNVAFLLIM